MSLTPLIQQLMDFDTALIANTVGLHSCAGFIPPGRSLAVRGTTGPSLSSCQ
jgi:hypothetical protein